MKSYKEFINEIVGDDNSYVNLCRFVTSVSDLDNVKSVSLSKYIDEYYHLDVFLNGRLRLYRIHFSPNKYEDYIQLYRMDYEDNDTWKTVGVKFKNKKEVLDYISSLGI